MSGGVEETMEKLDLSKYFFLLQETLPNMQMEWNQLNKVEVNLY